MKSVVVMCGLPGSGKTTHANQHGADVILSQDNYWVRPDGFYDFQLIRMDRCVAWFKSEVVKALQNPEINKIILDNTYLKREHRADILKLIRQTFPDVWVTIVHFVPAQDLTKHLRGHHVKDMHILQAMKSKFEIPSIDEGFNCYVGVPWTE